MSRDGFAGSALLGSCGAGTSLVPLPGHPVLPGMTPVRGRGDQLQAIPVEPSLHCPMGGTGLRGLHLPAWETEWRAEHVRG